MIAEQRRLLHNLGNPFTQRTVAAWRLATVSLMNGSAPASERTVALHLAQNAGVTTADFLRTRLMMQASIPLRAQDEAPNEEDLIWLLGLS